jgi:outer membrane translocation and assembly module TamA
VVAALLFVTGCNTIPEGRSAVYGLEVRDVSGASDGPDMAELESKIATVPSDKFFWLFRGIVYEYSLYEPSVLQRDLARIEAACRARGYYEAHARAARVHQTAKNHVRVEILVDPGPLTTVAYADVTGLDGIPAPLPALAYAAALGSLSKGGPFDEAAFETAKKGLERSLTERGYAYAKVTAKADVDLVSHRAFVHYKVDPGTPQRLGKVTLQGLGSLPEARVRSALSLREGEDYSTRELDEARQALLDLGVFSSVDIVPNLAGGPKANGQVDVKVELEPAKLKTVRLGAGLEFDVLKTAVTGLAGWEHRNFFGGVRVFRVDLELGLVLYPLRVNNFVAPERLLPEAKLQFSVRQPGIFGGRTGAFLRPGVDVAPVLLDPNPPKDATVQGYGEIRNTIGLDRTFMRFFGAVSHNLQAAYPFAYVGPKTDSLGTVLISYPELVGQLDFRDDRIRPHKGAFLSSSIQVAGLGGDARDIKFQPEARGYLPLGKRVTLAGKLGVGFLAPFNYGSAVYGNTDALSQKDRTFDYQLMYFRGFFSGGPSSNRGYPLRGVSPYADIGDLTPEQKAARLAISCEGDCRTPTGGFSLWELSLELRVDITGPLSAATFCDASDVSGKRFDIRLGHLHLSCGVGARYQTPVGPIRLDIGYRIPELQVVGGLTPDERELSKFLGIPLAVALGVGEAF